MSAWTMSPAREWSRDAWGRTAEGPREWRLQAAGTGGPRVVVPAGPRDLAAVRITARGRVVLVVAALVLVLLGVVVGMSNAAAGSGVESATGAGIGFVPVSVPVAAESTVVVRPGDTLWAIATRTFPGADPREAVVAFRAANGDRIESLQVGQRLTVPTRL